jgi:hypothetical protein
VGVTKREQDIKLGEMDFDEKRNIYKRKKLIKAGFDPDQVEKDKKKAWKQTKREAEKQRKRKFKPTEKKVSPQKSLNK